MKELESSDPPIISGSNTLMLATDEPEDKEEDSNIQNNGSGNTSLLTDNKGSSDSRKRVSNSLDLNLKEPSSSWQRRWSVNEIHPEFVLINWGYKSSTFRYWKRICNHQSTQMTSTQRRPSSTVSWFRFYHTYLEA